MAGRPRWPWLRWLADHEYAVLLAFVGVVYLVIYGGLLLWSDGLPFITDNNESFSTLWHARNMAEYGARDTYLLTDEVFSPHAAAHPFVHTHQGNFPRLFAFVLYVLGAQTIEAQIVVTTFSVGVLTVLLVFVLFGRLAGPRFACVVTLLLMTDYLFFAQWQLVTYRVWHAFFLFAGLVCAERVARSVQRRRWLLLSAACWAALFYYELVFAAFVSIFVGLYAAWLMRGAWWRLVGFGSVLGGAGVLSLVILGIQLTAYLGWDGVREDISITYLARNFASAAGDSSFASNSMSAYHAFIGRLTATDPAFQARLESFYFEHNVIFWWNLVDSRPLRTLTYFFGSMFVWVFQMYTPLLVLLVGIVLVGWGVGIVLDVTGPERLLARLVGARRPGQAGFSIGMHQPFLRGRLMFDVQVDRSSGLFARWTWLLTLFQAGVRIGPFALALLLLLLNLFRDQSFLGAPVARASFIQSTGGRALLLLVVGVIAGCLLLTRFASGRWLAADRLPVLRTWLISGLVLILAYVIRRQAGVYDQEYAPIWLGEIGTTIPALSARLAVLAAAGLGAGLVMLGDRRMLGERGAGQLRAVLPYLVAGGLAYSVVYYLAAGYVLTGYLVRFGPLLVFLTDILVALAVMIVALAFARAIGAVRSVRPSLRARRNAASVSDRPGGTASFEPAVAALGGVAVTGMLVLFLSSYWLHTQAYYLRVFPPDHFAFLKLLREPPYRGATFVVNTYAAPVAWQAQQWAYFDPQFSRDEVILSDGQMRLNRDLKTYVWLADRATNPEYLRPEYFVCSTPNHLRGVLERITRPPNPVGRCSDLAIVQNAGSGRPYLAHAVAERDDGPRDSWVILRLDWTLPDGLLLSEASAPGAIPARTGYSGAPADIGGVAVVSVTPGDGTLVGAEYFGEFGPIP